MLSVVRPGLNGTTGMMYAHSNNNNNNNNRKKVTSKGGERDG